MAYKLGCPLDTEDDLRGGMFFASSRAAYLVIREAETAEEIFYVIWLNNGLESDGIEVMFSEKRDREEMFKYIDGDPLVGYWDRETSNVMNDRLCNGGYFS